MEKNGLGLTVSSLKELPEIMEKLTEEDYNEFIRNIRPVRERLINGYYGRTAIQKAIELVRR